MVHKVLKSNLSEIEKIIEQIYTFYQNQEYGRIIYAGAVHLGELEFKMELNYILHLVGKKKDDFLIAGGKNHFLTQLRALKMT